MTPLFPPEARAALRTPGVAERWQAVQEQLHPPLAALAAQVEQAAAAALQRQWPLYELSYKHQRYLNRGRGVRDPIDDYWAAFDRPPRGSGVLISLSSAEQAILVGIQLWGARKPALAAVWATAQPVFQPLIDRIQHQGQARFTDPRRPGEDDPEQPWIERYLAARGASYLWAGFVYPWDAKGADLAERIVADAVELLALNEALMEAAEQEAPAGVLRERPERYQSATIPPIETIIERVRARGFAVSDLILRTYHVALQTRPFVILPGISGTGKTRLTRLYADAVYTIAPGRANPYYLIVAVQPDWHSARDLLGYYNALTGLFHPTPFLRFLLEATADPQQPYFVCLDELNLARPEYYLAPLLSAMETLEGTIDLGTPGAETPLAGGGMVRNPLRLPINLRLIGTVNVDESTFALSDKLLDRSNVIELTDIDLAAFRATWEGPIDPTLWAMLEAILPLFSAAGHPFGYRTIGEILRFAEQAAGSLAPQQAFDVQIKQRLLPRLRGEDAPRLRRALSELLALCLGAPVSAWGRAAQVTPEQLAAAPYPASAAKLRRMLERLDHDGFTDFYS
jgi:hypothetical protein